MDAKSLENLGRIVGYVNATPAEQAVFLERERTKIARKLRAARIRVKANKAANGGIYVPGK